MEGRDDGDASRGTSLEQLVERYGEVLRRLPVQLRVRAFRSAGLEGRGEELVEVFDDDELVAGGVFNALVEIVEDVVDDGCGYRGALGGRAELVGLEIAEQSAGCRADDDDLAFVLEVGDDGCWTRAEAVPDEAQVTVDARLVDEDAGVGHAERECHQPKKGSRRKADTTMPYSPYRVSGMASIDSRTLPVRPRTGRDQ